MKKEYKNLTVRLLVVDNFDIVTQSLQGADNIIADDWDDRTNIVNG
ncbi:MAG: hypothetical protein IJ506_02165 [Clostridia bacterium]|nr:hypothetical protein [Clostridia bacterium]